MLSATAVQGNRGRLPGAGERRGALPFPDLWILVPALLLLALGLLMVASASIPIGVNPKTGQGQPFHFLVRQASFVLAGLLAAGIVFQVPVARWRRVGRSAAASSAAQAAANSGQPAAWRPINSTRNPMWAGLSFNAGR